MESSRGILVVSFGTTYGETRKKTIEQIEREVAERYTEYRVYRAWTSSIVRKRVLERDGLRVMDVREALEQMAADGIREVIVQPTHVINGVENDQMKEAVLEYADRFEKIVTGAALLTTARDSERVIEAVVRQLGPAEDEALVLMGHGTEHFADAIYAALDYQFKDMDHANIFMGTVEGYPTLDAVRKLVRKSGLRKVVLAPFMIVAGDHAANDLSGEEEDSWKSVFEKDGYEVRCVLQGLGEYPEIREIILDHIAEAEERF